MNWNQYTLHITPRQEEMVTGLLYALGIEGVEIEDGRIPTAKELEKMFVDLSPELAPDELPPGGESRIRFYLRTEGEGALPQAGDNTDDSYTIHDKIWTPKEEETLIARLKEEWEALFPRQPFLLEKALSREEDWRDNWKQYYKPLLVNDLLILPVWEEIPAEYEAAFSAGQLRILRLEPGTAFGSGSHESTRLLLEGLQKWIRKGDRVLDIGCGSGILGLAALAYGAQSVVGTELDPACRHVVEENRALNGVGKDQFILREGNILEEPDLVKGSFDLILCNILAPVIKDLAAPGRAERYARPKSLFLTSGIYKEHREAVEAAFRENSAWEWVETTEMNDWVSVVARRR